MNEPEYIAVCALANELDEDESLESFDEAFVIIHSLLTPSRIFNE